MGEIVLLPGVERPDLVGEPMPGATVLQEAINLGVEEVVLVGRHRDGSRYVASSVADIDKAVGILMDGVACITTGSIVYETAIKPSDPDAS
jgi:hypothetical protein